MKPHLLFLMAILAISCNQPATVSSQLPTENLAADTDSLRAAFLLGWNKQDSAMIMHSIAEQAVVMNDSVFHTGKSAIAANWVSGGVKVLSNIQTSSSTRGAAEKMAYDAGTYSLDLTIPNGPRLKERGNYTLIWEKQEDGAMKLVLIHIEDITRMPDIQ